MIQPKRLKFYVQDIAVAVTDCRLCANVYMGAAGTYTAGSMRSNIPEVFLKRPLAQASVMSTSRYGSFLAAVRRKVQSGEHKYLLYGRGR